MTPSREEYDRWREDFVTRWVMAACAEQAEKMREAWIQASWGNGVANQQTLTECRLWADAYMALVEMTYEQWLNGQEEPKT